MKPTPFMKFLGRGIVLRAFGLADDLYLRVTGIVWDKEGEEVIIGQDTEGTSRSIYGHQIYRVWSQAR